MIYRSLLPRKGPDITIRLSSTWCAHHIAISAPIWIFVTDMSGSTTIKFSTQTLHSCLCIQLLKENSMLTIQCFQPALPHSSYMWNKSFLILFCLRSFPFFRQWASRLISLWTWSFDSISVFIYLITLYQVSKYQWGHSFFHGLFIFNALIVFPVQECTSSSLRIQHSPF